MRRKGAATRDGSRGVAVLEFTLSLVFLIPLLMATLSFGYYFYVGSNVEEASRQALKQALTIGLPCAAGGACDPLVIGALTAPASGGTGTACLGSAAACYMDSPPLSLGASTTVTCACAPPVAPATNPTFTITVRVDFPPAVGYFKYLMPVGTPASNTKYTATLIGSN